MPLPSLVAHVLSCQGQFDGFDGDDSVNDGITPPPALELSHPNPSGSSISSDLPDPPCSSALPSQCDPPTCQYTQDQPGPSRATPGAAANPIIIDDQAEGVKGKIATLQEAFTTFTTCQITESG